MITRSLSIRRSLKLPNHVAWRFIIYLIESKNLKITFHKVKAHSGDQYNDLADEPANSARLLPPIELNSSKFPGTLMTPIWASLGLIDRDIRRFLREITDCITFTQFLHNSTLKPLFDKFNSDDIHWPLTQDWLHFNPTDDICSSHKSIYNAFQTL